MKNLKHIQSYAEFISENNSADDIHLLDEAKAVMIKLLDTYGLRYINGTALDSKDAEGHYNLAKEMTDKRGEVKFERDRKIRLFFPLKADILNTIGASKKFFKIDTTDRYLEIMLNVGSMWRSQEIYGSISTSDPSIRWEKKFDPEMTKDIINSLIDVIENMEKKEWKPSPEDIRNGLSGLRNL